MHIILTMLAISVLICILISGLGLIIGACSSIVETFRDEGLKAFMLLPLQSILILLGLCFILFDAAMIVRHFGG